MAIEYEIVFDNVIVMVYILIESEMLKFPLEENGSLSIETTNLF